MKTNPLDLGCPYCYSTKKVYDVTQLRRGQHITISGESSSIRCFNRYSHHAIVKSCQALNDNMVVLTLIHVCASPQEEIRHPRETTEIYDLVSDKIQIVNYMSTTFPDDNVISRAESEINKRFAYNVLTENCEHFCHMCCIDKQESRQAADFIENAPQKSFDVICFFGVFPPKIEMLQQLNFVFQLIVLGTKYYKGKICKECCKKKGMHLLLCLVFQIILIYSNKICIGQASAIFRGLLKVPCLFQLLKSLGSFLSSKEHWANVEGNDTTTESAKIVYKRAIPTDNLPRDLKWINSRQSRSRTLALFLESKFVKERDEITEGQVVSFKYGMFWHKAISTKIVFDDNCPAKFDLTVIHYDKSYTVSEETIPFNLRKKDIWIDVIHPINRFRKEDIVRRARARKGEQKYNLFYNRSCHFANEVAMNNDFQVVTNLRDLEPGNAVRFYRKSNKKDACDAIVANVQSICDIITVIHYSFDKSLNMTVQKELINLNTLAGKNIYLLDFNGYATYSLETVVERAESRVGEQRFNRKKNTSRDLVFWSKVVQIPSIVHFSGIENYPEEWLLLPKFHNDLQKITVQSWCDLEVGDIVEFQKYWIRHYGILYEINEETENISVIHCGATREIVKEEMPLELKLKTLQIYKANPLKANSRGRIVLLADERIGKKKWEFGYTSWNFCLNCVFKNMLSNHW